MTLPSRIGAYIEHVQETGNAYEPGDVRDGDWHQFSVAWDRDAEPDVWIDDEYHPPDAKLNDLSDAIARSAHAALERTLVSALAEGYDGVDVEHTPSGTVYHRWNDSPPSYSPFSAPAGRYELHDVTFGDLREAWKNEDGEYRDPPEGAVFDSLRIAEESH